MSVAGRGLWTSDPLFRAHIVGAIRWALHLESEIEAVSPSAQSVVPSG